MYAPASIAIPISAVSVNGSIYRPSSAKSQRAAARPNVMINRVVNTVLMYILYALSILKATVIPLMLLII